MKAFVLRLPDDLYERLRRLAASRGQSMNETLTIWTEVEVARAERTEKARR